MLRDNRVGLIEPILAAREMILSRCGLEPNRHRTIDPRCLENPRPKGGTSTLVENVVSPFQAEPRQCRERPIISCLLVIWEYSGDGDFNQPGSRPTSRFQSSNPVRLVRQWSTNSGAPIRKQMLNKPSSQDRC
jgi:hypothetical protein